jgi:hypothetical protein
VQFPKALWNTVFSQNKIEGEEQRVKVNVALERYSRGFVNELSKEIQGVLHKALRDSPFTQNDFDTLLVETSQQLQAVPPCVILVGPTGVGKTLLFNWLVGKTIVSVAKGLVSSELCLPGEKVLEAIDPVGAVGHEASKTRSIRWAALDQNTVIVDTPGLGDTDGLSAEVANGLKLAALADKVCGIVYGVRYDLFKNRDSQRQFIENLKVLQRFLADHPKSSAGKIHWVITHLPEGNIASNEMRKVIVKLLKSTDYLGADKQLFDFRISLCGSDDLEGRVTCPNLLDPAQRQPLVQAITALQASPIPSRSLGVALSASSVLALRGLRDERLAQIQKTLAQVVEAMQFFGSQKRDAVDQLKQALDQVSSWSVSSLSQCILLKNPTPALKTVLRSLHTQSQGFHKMNGLFEKAEQEDLQLSCKPAVDLIQHTIEQLKADLATKYDTAIYEEAKASLKKMLCSHEVQKNVKTLSTQLAPFTDPIETVLKRLPQPLLDQIAHRDELFKRKVLAEGARTTEIRMKLERAITSTFTSRSQHGELSVQAKVPCISLKAVLKALGRVAEEDLVIEGDHLYLDADLKGSDFTNKNITLRFKTIQVMEHCTASLPVSSQYRQAILQIIGMVEGKCTFDPETKAAIFNVEKDTREGFKGMWPC